MFLARNWIQATNAIPHFSKVIGSVQNSEGIEITMNCNTEAFEWIINLAYLKTNSTDEDLDEDEIEHRINLEFDKITEKNCLNKLVTSFFLGISWIYTRVFFDHLITNVSDIINQCKISLNNINENISYHIASLISEQHLSNLKERKVKGDKFLSNLYRARIDHRLLRKKGPKDSSNYPDIEAYIQAHVPGIPNLYWCNACKRLFTTNQANQISCLQNDQAQSSIGPNGQIVFHHAFSESSVDLETLVVFIRQKFRICWKEIYLKINALLALDSAEQCSNCNEFFQLPYMATCQACPTKFHEPIYNLSSNHLKPPAYYLAQQEIQVIDGVMSEKEMTNLLEMNKHIIQFIEPQSMNFDKKINPIYREFMASKSFKEVAPGEADKNLTA